MLFIKIMFYRRFTLTNKTGALQKSPGTNEIDKQKSLIPVNILFRVLGICLLDELAIIRNLGDGMFVGFLESDDLLEQTVLVFDEEMLDFNVCLLYTSDAADD